VILKHFDDDKFVEALLSVATAFRHYLGRRGYEEKAMASYHDEATRHLLIKGECDGVHKFIEELKRMQASALSKRPVLPGQA